MNLTDKHIHILRHSLGLDEKGHGKEYRNYYCSGKYCDGYQDLLDLCEAGLMGNLGLSRIDDKNICFWVTTEGRKAALRDVVYPKLTRSQKRYRRFREVRDAFQDMTFLQFLKSKYAKEISSILILSLCLSAAAQPAPPTVDTNALAKTKALVAAFQATNVVVPVPMVTNVIQTFPMFYPVGIPHGANMMTSTDNQHWSVGQYFDITKSNLLSFTNPANSTNFWMIVLMPPQIISISNSFTPTNTVTNSTSSK